MTDVSTNPSDHLERVVSEIANQDATFSRQGTSCFLVSDDTKTEFHEAFSFHSEAEAERFFEVVTGMVELKTGHVEIVCNSVPLVP